MAASPDTAAAWNAAPLTKFRAPRIRRDVVARPALLERLKSAVDSYPLTLICAPGGFGKTTLLAQLAAGTAADTVLLWATIDEDDNDRQRFFGTLLRMVESMQLAWEIPPATLLANAARSDSQSRSALASFVNALCTVSVQRIVLVLDDLHSVDHPGVVEHCTAARSRIICGSAAILLTGLTSAVFTTAAPRPREDVKTAVRTAGVVSAAVDATLVDRGRYIVKTAGCNDCHTPGYAETGGAVDEKQWLVGGGPGWQGGWGTTFPINLRLFMQSLSAEQWLKIARAPSRPPMPWFALRDMSDADLVAIYHYVRSLGAAGTAAPDFLPPGKASAAPVVKFPG